MREIDVTTWDRAMHCQVFRNSVQPQYSVTFELDITNFLSRIKDRNYPFTYLDKGSELFKVVNVEMKDTIEEYVTLAAKTVGDQKEYFIRDDKVILPFSVQVHHSFVDGIHIGKLAEILQNYLDWFE